MRSFQFLLVSFGIFAMLACSNEEFSTMSAAATTTSVPACTTGTVYDSTSGTCVASTTVTATPTPTPTATPTTTSTTTTTTTSGTTCQSGYVYSDTYGCIPQQTCGSDQGWYGGMCIQLHGALCQDFCPAGMTNTLYGCLPQIPQCPPCSGVAYGICYWGMDYLTYWGLL